MTGFEPWTSGVENDRFTNYVATTAQTPLDLSKHSVEDY